MDYLSVLGAYSIPKPERVEPLGGAGGFSGAQFWRIKTLGSLLCLRRWPRENPTEEGLCFIHDVLFHVAREGFRSLPVPQLASRGRSFVSHGGHLWELTPWMPGEADFRENPTPKRLTAAMQTLARFHLAAASYPEVRIHRGPSPGIRDRLNRARQLFLVGLSELADRVDLGRYPQIGSIAKETLALAPVAVPAVLPLLESLASQQVPLQPCIRDIWHDHVLFEGDQMTGLIDFGSMQVDNVATDVARLLGSLAGDDADPWRVGLEAYQAVRPLNEIELLLVEAFDKSTVLLSGLNWIDWIYRQGRTFDDWQAVAGRLQGILGRLRFLADRGGIGPLNASKKRAQWRV